LSGNGPCRLVQRTGPERHNLTRNSNVYTYLFSFVFIRPSQVLKNVFEIIFRPPILHFSSSLPLSTCVRLKTKEIQCKVGFQNFLSFFLSFFFGFLIDHSFVSRGYLSLTIMSNALTSGIFSCSSVNHELSAIVFHNINSTDQLSSQLKFKTKNFT